MKRYCLALDLKDDQDLITEYENHHRHVSPEIKKSISDAGIINMEVYRTGNRLFMIIEAMDNFSFEAKAALDAANNKVRGMGSFDVEISTTSSLGKARREMDIDGKNILSCRPGSKNVEYTLYDLQYY